MAQSTVIVTGASSGIGLEFVKQFLSRDDKVIALVRQAASSATGVDVLSGLTGDLEIVTGCDVASDSIKVSR